MEFRIKALDGARAVVSCVLDAVDELDARRQLTLKEMRVISVIPLRRLRLPRRTPQLHLAVFSQQLVSLLDAGLSLVESLEALAERDSKSGTHRTLERVLGRLYEGQTLATALSEHPEVFPPLYVASVRASERTGALQEALTRYIAYAEQAEALRKTLVNACIYPAVLLGAGLLVTLFLMGYVVPRFSSIYEDVGSDLPAASRLLLQWGQLMDAHAGLMVLLTVAWIGSAVYLLTRPAARARVGDWITRIPSVGRQLHLYQMARLYRTTGMLLRGGMPAVAALQMSAGLLRAGSRPAFAAATQCVREGQSLAQAMERNGLTNPVAARMLKVGERSGNMGEMMERIASFCDEELARWVAVVTRLIEPVLMTVIGLVIGVIVVLMYFPIFQLAGSIR
ncbi:MAG: Type secretion system domain protein [Gammaproteobacteria bacterium]|nr:Type secretion system domain protein [Gammaproteobacteria bacterium]